MAVNKSPSFKFYAQDFLTGVMYLTNEEIGMYMKMLCKQWTDERIPKKRLGFLIGYEWDKISEELKNKFEDHGEYLINKRLEEQRHWNWKGGITPLNQRIRASIEYRKWRKDVFERDNYTCQNCFRHGVPLNAHHIKYFSTHPEQRTDINNGITLCVPCHKKEHSNG